MSLSFPSLGRFPNPIDLAQLATSPPVDRMRLFHPLLPWYIDVHEHQANGVTVYDVVQQVFFALQQPISARHYYNEELNSSVRERIAIAFGRRTQGDERERASGVKWVDYLEDKVVFVGLVRTRNGLWEMKTVAA
ncbi:hypothetical protein C0993_005548 [Termitomyces sp. T159_Od127]|nr:hypothetical protein C0993_005548 [Termitomyces sp. T159_Od127]